MSFMDDNTSSALAARRIYAATVNAIQDADEIVGPEAPDYIELMDALAAECTRRAATARENFPPMLDALKAEFPDRACELMWTGGNCRALSVAASDRGAYWMITGSDGGYIPENHTEPCAVGLYSKDGDDWVCFCVTNFAAACALIRSCDGLQFANDFDQEKTK
jgi:hypothetical protein